MEVTITKGKWVWKSRIIKEGGMSRDAQGATGNNVFTSTTQKIKKRIPSEGAKRKQLAGEIAKKTATQTEIKKD